MIVQTYKNVMSDYEETYVKKKEDHVVSGDRTSSHQETKTSLVGPSVDYESRGVPVNSERPVTLVNDQNERLGSGRKSLPHSYPFPTRSRVLGEGKVDSRSPLIRGRLPLCRVYHRLVYRSCPGSHRAPERSREGQWWL